MIFAITDIETTGSHASGNSIIEIGICLHDGRKIIREFSTLLDPGMRLPSFITALTGIDDDMLEGAPAFHQVADELEEIFEEAVFVAHNVNFDHSFIKAEFAAIGRAWNPRRVCTMRLARKAFPGLRSYGLGNLCRELDIINESAHRALSDARAAAEIFSRSLDILPEDEIRKMIGRASGDIFLPPNLDISEYNALPEKPGVYFMLNEKGKPIYIGKAANLRKRVRQHFTVNSSGSRMQAFMREIHHLTYELTGTELIALLLEDEQIRKHWPAYNAAQKRKTPSVHVVRYTDRSGYDRLAIQNSKKLTTSHKTFTSVYMARTWLSQMAAEFSMDMRLVGLDIFDMNAELPAPEEHNTVLAKALEEMQLREPSFIITGDGRSQDERSLVLVKNGELQGYAFVSGDDIRPEEVEDVLRRLPRTETNVSIITSLNENFPGYRRLDLNGVFS